MFHSIYWMWYGSDGHSHYHDNHLFATTYSRILSLDFTSTVFFVTCRIVWTSKYFECLDLVGRSGSNGHDVVVVVVVTCVSRRETNIALCGFEIYPGSRWRKSLDILPRDISYWITKYTTPYNRTLDPIFEHLATIVVLSSHVRWMVAHFVLLGTTRRIPFPFDYFHITTTTPSSFVVLSLDSCLCRRTCTTPRIGISVTGMCRCVTHCRT
mmetsp:Transcript_7642/g.11572  ORF Transcript_7642/g.11572 Transcript_7642/m.11572 type:complete len:211 (+) Transcript_7642:805-1437(+)